MTKTWKNVIESGKALEEISGHLARYADGSYLSAQFAPYYQFHARMAVRITRMIDECLALFNPAGEGMTLGYWLIHDSPLTAQEREQIREWLFDQGRY